MTEYGLGTRGLSTRSIDVMQNTPFSRDTGLGGPAGTTAPLQITAQTHIPYFQQNGLRIAPPGSTGSSVYTITPGSIRDFGDIIDLNYGTIGGAAISFDLGNLFGTGSGVVVQTQRPGTISSSGTAVTGVGSSFTTDFADFASGSITDINVQRGNVAGTGVVFNVPSLISIAGFTDNTQVITNNLSLTTAEAITAGAGSPYFRGGVAIKTNTVTSLVYAICLARRDTDNLVSLIASSFTKSGIPDLPSGYTRYRAIGYISIASNGSVFTFTYIAQPLLPATLIAQGDMSYFHNLLGLQTRLPIGSSGQFLKVSGGIPTWT